MALPIIITNYSGPTAYASEDNAYLLPVREGLNSEGFVEPDGHVLVSLLRHVVAHPQEAREKGRRARAAMEQVSPRAVASAMAHRLRGLAKMRGWEE